MSDIGDFRELADRLADTARTIVREGRDRLAMDIKADGSPVTAIDRAVERALREILAREAPDHGVLGEEFGPEGLDREFVWVLDPIDGTKQFAAGLPGFGVLIALCRNARPELGIIEQPLTGERTLGLSGGGCWLNGRPVRTSGKTDLAECIAGICNPDSFGPSHDPGMQRLRGATRWNVWDTGCLGYASLARGTIDVTINGPNLDAFDICALVPVVQGAGGSITAWDGGALTLQSEGAIVASASEELHAAVCGLLNDGRA
ncbi:MAG: inositol monophosphatase family protein [Thalassobaculum sp.]|uniref:inositol monophosphatase family protein n=1 Tax=Thalassobaculum sp. TaxID=2022740 RepID=UPI0032ECFAF0